MKQELVIRLCLALLYISSLVSGGLWMAGYFEPEQVTYARFSGTTHFTNEEENRESKVGMDSTQSREEIKTEEQADDNFTKIVQTSNKVHTLDINYDLQLVEASLDWKGSKPFKVIATGYTAGVESTGKDPTHPQYGVTYSGVQVRRDLYSTIAADTKIFPLGTILYIPNYGYGVVADIGSAIKGNKIDLYYETVEDVYNLWGKQEVEVYLIRKGDGRVTEAMLDKLNQEEAVQVFKLS